MTIVNYAAGDISIKKVENGWLLIESHHTHPERLMYTVFESDFNSNSNTNVDDAHSLMRLVGEAFESYCRSDKTGGIILEFNQEGWENEQKETLLKENKKDQFNV